METDSEVWAAWEEFEKLSSRSSRIWGDYGDAKDRWQSCLKESRQGATFLKRKLDARNKVRVKAWQVRIMGKQCGLVEVRDLQVNPGTGGDSCPF